MKNLPGGFADGFGELLGIEVNCVPQPQSNDSVRNRWRQTNQGTV